MSNHAWEALLNLDCVKIPQDVMDKGLRLAREIRRRTAGVEAADIVLRRIFADFEAEACVCWKRVETIQFEPIRLASDALAMGIGLRLEGYEAAKALRQRCNQSGGTPLSIIEREGAYYIDLSAGIGDAGLPPCETWQDFHSSWREWCFKATGLNQFQLMEQAVRNALGGSLDGIQYLYDFQHRSGFCVKKLKQQMYFCTGKHCRGKRNQQFDRCWGAWCWTLGAKEKSRDLEGWGFTGERVKFLCARDSHPIAIPAHPLEVCVQKADAWADEVGLPASLLNDTLEEALFRAHFMETELAAESDEPQKIAPWPSSQPCAPPRPSLAAPAEEWSRIAPESEANAASRADPVDFGIDIGSQHAAVDLHLLGPRGLPSSTLGYAPSIASIGVPSPLPPLFQSHLDLQTRMAGSFDVLGSSVGVPGTPAPPMYGHPSLVSPPLGLEAAIAPSATSRPPGHNFGYNVATAYDASTVAVSRALGSTAAPFGVGANRSTSAAANAVSRNNAAKGQGAGLGHMAAAEAWEIVAGLMRLSPDQRAKLQDPDPKNNGKHDIRDQKKKLKEAKNNIIDLAYCQAPEATQKQIFKTVKTHCVVLAQHELGSLCVASLFRQGSQTEQCEMVLVMAPEVLELAKHSEGTRVVQVAVEVVSPRERELLLAVMMEEGKIMQVIGNPNAVFLIRSCLSLVVRKMMQPEWVAPVIKTVNDRIKDIVDNKKTLQFSYKLILWVVECGHRVQMFDSAKSRILTFCSKVAKTLIDTKYGNILLRHALQFGSADHQERIFEVALESLKEVHDKRWYASHVIDMCADLVKHDPSFNEELKQRFMQVVVQHLNYPGGRESPFERMFRSSNGKRTARRVYECVSEEFRAVMRQQVPDIEKEELLKGSASFDSTLFNDGNGEEDDGLQ
mmetsp:Transcript_28824/g.73053  ORF Transcript_28824/g.73053 Transcript_28824/m.73053 type:complete len:902 (-) Transcript_28824:108-2813(-)